MPTNRKISQLPLVGTPARANVLTALDALGANVRGLVSSWLGLVADSDVNFTDITTGDVSAAKHGFAPKLPAGATAYLNNASYLQFRDQQSQNTQGGTFTAGSWQTRVLNTEVSDIGGFGVLAANQITLAAGTYLIAAVAPAWAVGNHQARLQNVTAGTTLVLGTSSFATTTGGGGVPHSFVRGIFTVAAGQALELQQQCQTTKTTNGFGIASNFTTEVYSVVELWKIG